MLSAEQLKYLRLVHNLTLQNVADVMGTSKNYLSMIENRKTPYSEEKYREIVDAIYRAHAIKNANKDVTENIEVVAEEVKTKKKTTKK